MKWQFNPPPHVGLDVETVASCESMFAAGRLTDVMSLLDDGYLRAAVLLEWVEGGLLTRDQAYETVHAVWTSSKNPLLYLSTTDWIKVFRSVRYEVPSSAWRVWRGADHPYVPGMSWTTRRDVALTFAERQAGYGNTAAVFAATAPVGAVLAVFEEASLAGEEAEVVVNPEMLLDLTVDEMLSSSEEAIHRLESLHARLGLDQP